MSGRYLLDTHAIIWWSTDLMRLPARVRAVLEDKGNIVYFSPVSAMEITTKVRMGRLAQAADLAVGFTQQMVERGFTELPLLSRHGEAGGGFGAAHNDPWDRLLAAQAADHDVPLISCDAKMTEFPVSLFW